MRSSVSSVVDGVRGFGANNVSYGGSVNFSSSMIGVIILSIMLIVLAILDIVSLIRQIVFFKQFKVVRESKFEKSIEKKIKSKISVVVFVCIVDMLSIIVGVAGIFVNVRSFSGNNMSWVLYVVDGLIAVLALISLILLFIKIKKIKKHHANNHAERDCNESLKHCDEPIFKKEFNVQDFGIEDMNEIEIMLLKLRHLKAAKLISNEEYNDFRNKILPKQNIKEKRYENFEQNKN